MTVDTSVEAIGDKIIVAPEAPDEVTAGGIVLPPDAQKPSQQATVVAFGEDVECVRADDVVLIAKYAGAELKVGDRDLLVIRADDILARVIETPAE